MGKIKVIQPKQKHPVQIIQFQTDLTTLSQNPKPVCKYCNSEAVVKFGTYEGIQRYWCKVCKRKFRANDELFQMKTPANQVSSAVGMFYEGVSLNGIRRHLQQEYNNYPSSKSVYGWVVKYTNEAVNQFNDYHPDVGKNWVADETILRLDGKNIWCIDIIDRDTRFLLATKLSTNRETKDIKELLEKAKARAGKNPEKLLTDGWKAYIEASESVFGADSKHIVTDPFAGKDNDNTELIERWHGTLKSRTKTLRGLKSIETANRFLDGYLVYYNFLRPHETLEGKTPAEKAGIQYTTKTWVDITRNAKPQIEVLTTPSSTSILSERKPLVRPASHRTYNYANKTHLRKQARIRESRHKSEKGVFANKEGSLMGRHPFKGGRRIM